MGEEVIDRVFLVARTAVTGTRVRAAKGGALVSPPSLSCVVEPVDVAEWNATVSAALRNAVFDVGDDVGGSIFVRAGI